MKRPRQVSIALTMLWLGFGFASLEVIVAVVNQFDMLPPSGVRTGWGMNETVGLLGILFQAICIVSVTRGHGVVRWPLLLGIGWIASRIGFSGMFRVSESLAPYHRIEPLGLAVHTMAVGLLFLPSSNFWFRHMQRQRREVSGSTTSDDDQVRPPVG